MAAPWSPGPTPGSPSATGWELQLPERSIAALSVHAETLTKNEGFSALGALHPVWGLCFRARAVWGKPTPSEWLDPLWSLPLLGTASCGWQGQAVSSKVPGDLHSTRGQISHFTEEVTATCGSRVRAQLPPFPDGHSPAQPPEQANREAREGRSPGISIVPSPREHRKLGDSSQEASCRRTKARLSSAPASHMVLGWEGHLSESQGPTFGGHCYLRRLSQGCCEACFLRSTSGLLEPRCPPSPPGPVS